jgi:uncharacterized membrane protein YwzB
MKKSKKASRQLSLLMVMITFLKSSSFDNKVIDLIDWAEKLQNKLKKSSIFV